MSRWVLGVDLGGTNIVAGCVREDGHALAGFRSEPTRADEGPDAVVDRIVGLGRQAVDDTRAAEPGAEILGVGIGAPGPLDRERGLVLLTPNLGWVDMPLRDRVGGPLGLEAALDNDANCAVLGEWWRGAAQGTRHAIGFTLGTGVGGGIILDGRLYHGASDVAGEIGHITIDANGRRCACGNDGCLEAYASGTAIARRAIEALQAGAPSSLGALDPVRITAQTVYQAASEGDPLARDVVRDTARYLGAGVATVVNIFNPEIVVICGGVTLAGEGLFGPLRQEVARRAFKPAVAVCRIVAGEVIHSAGVYGAARAFLEQRGQADA
jgi:glucokinase